MNKLAKIKADIGKESAKAGIVILGAVAGTAAIKGIRKLTADHPQADAILEYTLPVLVAGGGIILAAATEEKSKLKYFGYGLAAAGTLEGIRVIPVAKDFFAGTLGETEIPAATAYYSENEERQKIMSGFGLASLPMGNATMQDAVSIPANLPDLEGAEDQPSEDLGYNPSQTEDADMSGII